ncbi:hypothetical protein J6590_043761 [Homalodisca vitripennis]|nr:hypothetical protein J6590_043761 [Homalodisca vitripennis]
MEPLTLGLKSTTATPLCLTQSSFFSSQVIAASNNIAAVWRKRTVRSDTQLPNTIHCPGLQTPNTAQVCKHPSVTESANIHHCLGLQTSLSDRVCKHP